LPRGDGAVSGAQLWLGRSGNGLFSYGPIDG
jgi:hypothetical protein